MGSTVINQDIALMKKTLAEVLRNIGLIKDGTDAEITIGVKNGGIAYIAKKETYK